MSVGRRTKLFDEFSKWGFDAKGWSPTTRHRYFARALACEVWLAQNRDVSLIYAKPKDFQAYLFSTPPSARNRNNIRQALVAFGEFLLDRGYSEVNSALSLPRLPEPTCLPKPLTNEQAARVVIAAKVAKEEALVFAFLYAGLRKTEGRLLQRRSIEGNTIRVKGKGDKERILPMHPRLREAIRKHLQGSTEARWVFPSTRLIGCAISDTRVRHIISEVGEIAGIPGLHPHALRHTFATRLSDQGVPLEVIQELLGHADPKTTRIYTKVRPQRFFDAIELLDFREEGSGAALKVGSQHADPGPLLGRLSGTP
jgi:site-specific recombinase XerD